jgi:hypothetical protein
MTTGVVVMIGAGLLLIISAIENSSIIATFQAIWGGQPISTLGAASTSTTAAPKAAAPKTGAAKPPQVLGL